MHHGGTVKEGGRGGTKEAQWRGPGTNYASAMGSGEPNVKNWKEMEDQTVSGSWGGYYLTKQTCSNTIMGQWPGEFRV